MRAIGKYYKTMLRDEATAETEFEFSYLDGDCKHLCKNGLLRCRGRISIISSGIPLTMIGEQRGPYFYVTKYSFLDSSPVCAKEMLRYLTGDELTDKQEDKILERCGNDIMNLLKDRNILETILARNKKKAEIQRKVYKKLKALCEQEKLTKQLLRYGVELNKIEILYQHDVTEEQYKKNPYLISVFHAISVYQADQFAYEVTGIQPYDLKRLCGYVMDAMNQYKKAGHSCVKVAALCRYVNNRLSKSVYPGTKINPAILNCCIGKLQKYMGIHVVNQEVYVYDNEIWEEETEIITHIERLNREKKEWVTSVDLQKIESLLGITYNEQQKEAFQLLKGGGVKILTGPPGSGKTAIIKGLIMAMEDAYPGRNVKVRLSATTGRAAQVMSNSSKRDAETVNKMLEIRPYGDKIHGKNQNDPVDADFIIVDEVSMLGTKLAAALLSAIQTGSILLLVGDEHQLQSVEYGNVLQDLIQSGTIEVRRLTEIMRQSGSICENALLINQGKTKLIEDKMFHIHECDEEQAKQLLFAQLNKPGTQVVSSVKKGVLGTYELNREIQKRINRGKKICLLYKRQVFYEQDYIILTETNYEKGYFNGDIGWIISKDEDGLLVQFENKVLCLDQNDFHVMELAYAITTHKSQGSEFQHIHILLPRNPENMLTRRILYTAITRAKTDVHIYSIDSAMEYAIQNKAEKPRMSLLAVRLKK